MNSVIASYKQGARLRGYSFDLSRAVMIDLFGRSCFYCGQPPANQTKLPSAYGQFTYNGIDRYDSSLGYTDSNCVTCCFHCNKTKGRMSGDEFIAMARRISTHRTYEEASS